MPVPPPFHLDPAEPEDLPAAWGVYLASTDPGLRDASRRPAPGRPEIPPRLYPHLLATSEGAFWVARRAGQVVGFAAAVSRGRTCFVSELWVGPGHRGQGIGTRLFRMVRRAIRGARGRVLAGLAGADPGGLIIALRAGLLPRFPILHMEGDPEAARRLWRSHRPPSSTRMARYDPRAPLGPRSPLLALDREARGGTRPQDHVHWMNEPDRVGFLLWRGKRALAYLYVNGEGEVGPLAAAGPPGMQAAVALAVKEASKRSSRIRLRVPAVNGAALEALVGAGFRLERQHLLVSGGEFGRLDRYLPGDDSLF